MDIRSIEADELDVLLALFEHLHPDDEPLPLRSQVEAVWQAIMANPSQRYFGLYSHGLLVASCGINLIANLTRGCRPFALIENVVTHAEYRGCGYGQALLAHALAFAWEQGCYKVMLMTSSKDPATLRFYEAAGFDRYGKQAFIAKTPL
ncbi:Acetyltransferase (GNAT) family protein [Pseudomonas guineae]|uniref:Acetyltransferase (GNAT) family protein n=1 Tax=Pseudomonas guineae TaxID=425504 RepID=A0A1I3N8A7_9PSED|nr:GNAT family N-acetyltransferase [Pseudomonas guineae]SFJ05462.1 Acetyltransferase (GNAT) family protein [Pseudomonas guineae]